VRLKIMNAARELFASHGVEAVSMRKIAEAVEYSPTIIYQHFADKESLLHEICTEDFSSLAGVFSEIATVADPLKRIEQIGLAYARFGLEYPNHYRLMFMTPHPADDSHSDSQCGKGDPDEDGYAFLKKSVAEAIAAGRYRDGLNDADLISQVLWSAMHGLVSLQITKGQASWLEWRPFEQRIKLTLESLQRGIERKGKQP